jgi:hypothetical protein
MAGSTLPRPPKGLGTAGRALWREVNSRFVFDAHELVVLTELCRCKDRLELLEAVIKEVGVADANGKVPQAVREAREQALMAARLAAQLRFPQGKTGDHQAGARRQPQRRGTRGIYAIRGGAG